MERLIPFIPYILLAVLVAWGAGVYAILSNSPAGTSGQVSASGAPDVGGPFTLTAADGRTVTDGDFRGKVMVVFFGFTTCPDVCPAGLLHMAEALQRLGPKAGHVAPVFITVDPERDTPEQMRAYTQHFDPRIVGLTGTAEQIAAAARAYRVYYRRTDLPGSALGYTMDHSSIVYVMDTEGRYVTHFTHETAPEDMAATLARLLPD